MKTITILLPRNWNYSTATPGATFEDDAEFLVDTANPAYGKIPYTIQVELETRQEQN